jgi:FkbM family methyltransferase
MFTPPRCKVTPDDLYAEVAEYFDLGVSVERGATVLDVGANIGAFALRIAEACDGDIRILAFEPSPDTFMALAANFEQNPMLRKTSHRLFHLGLSSGDRVGESIAFYDFARFPTNSTFHLSAKRREFEIFFEEHGRRIAKRIFDTAPNAIGRALGALAMGVVSALPRGGFGWWLAQRVMGLREHTVRVETLTHVLESETSIDRIDLLKIDVEGPELEILRGMDHDTWNKVQQVVLETHNRDGRLYAIHALLAREGFCDIQEALQKTVDNGLDSIVVYARR